MAEVLANAKSQDTLRELAVRLKPSKESFTSIFASRKTPLVKTRTRRPSINSLNSHSSLAVTPWRYRDIETESDSKSTSRASSVRYPLPVSNRRVAWPENDDNQVTDRASPITDLLPVSSSQAILPNTHDKRVWQLCTADARQLLLENLGPTFGLDQLDKRITLVCEYFAGNAADIEAAFPSTMKAFTQTEAVYLEQFSNKISKEAFRVAIVELVSSLQTAPAFVLFLFWMIHLSTARSTWLERDESIIRTILLNTYLSFSELPVGLLDVFLQVWDLRQYHHEAGYGTDIRYYVLSLFISRFTRILPAESRTLSSAMAFYGMVLSNMYRTHHQKSVYNEIDFQRLKEIFFEDPATTWYVLMVHGYLALECGEYLVSLEALSMAIQSHDFDHPLRPEQLGHIHYGLMLCFNNLKQYSNALKEAASAESCYRQSGVVSFWRNHQLKLHVAEIKAKNATTN